MASLNPRLGYAATLVCLFLLTTSNVARAATLFVTSTNDSGPGSLRAEIAAASPGDTIRFTVTGTISLMSTLSVATNLTISGPTTSPGITIDGGGSVPVMVVFGLTTVNLQNLTIAHGFAGGGGGGMFISLGGAATITSCTFSGNTTAGDGGGIVNSGTLTITNSTFSGNKALTGAGGAIANVGTVTVTNSTFSGNSAAGSFGGGINDVSGFGVTLKGTILADEAGGNCDGGITDAGYNISDDNTCGFTVPPIGTSINNSATLNLDPLGLQNNGGPTQTIALEPNSQAVDFIPVVDCTVATDQRGFPRPDSGNLNFCDAGAFELQTGRITVVPGSEKTQIARSTTSSDSDKVNMAFSFIDHGSPTLGDDGAPGPIALNCNAGTDALNGIMVDLFEGHCASLATSVGGLELDLSPFVVHTVGTETYGTLFQMSPTVPSPETVSVRIVQLTKPEGTCGEWTVNIEVAGLDTMNLGLSSNPFALVVEDSDKNEGCFDIDNAIVGNQITAPTRGVRRGVRR
jgi:hypothetical protein